MFNYKHVKLTLTNISGLNPHNLKIPTPNQQIRTTAFVAQSPGISSSTAATFTVRPGMTLVARQGFPMQALQTAVQQAQQQQPKTLKGQTTSQVQIQPQQIQINPQTAVIQTSKVVIIKHIHTYPCTKQNSKCKVKLGKKLGVSHKLNCVSLVHCIKPYHKHVSGILIEEILQKFLCDAL